jgi:NADP-dependent 3-hydroxy acid dehydrogenase YdfG
MLDPSGTPIKGTECPGRGAFHTITSTIPQATLNKSHKNTMAPRVFLITGTSTGFGEQLVKVVLGKGDHVVATARNSSKLSFPDANDSNSLLVDLDVTKKDSIDKAFEAAVKKFKRVDVVVNNAGYVS